jgi:hypothetical protein
MIDFHRINRAAMPILPAIVRRLLPGGKVHSREYVVRNPRRFDRHPGSFKINLATGQWADFATTDRGGDPISLIAWLEGVSQPEAAKLLARMLSIDAGSVDE